MTKGLRIAILAIAAISLIAGQAVFAQGTSVTQVKKAYQTLNDGFYVVEGTVRLEDGEVVDCDIEEINTPIFWGNFSQNKITKEEAAQFSEDNVYTALFDFHGAAAPTKFAKYVQVGGVVFTAGTNEKGYILYSSNQTGEIVPYLDMSEDNIAWFFKEMRAGNFWLLKEVANGYEKVDIAAFFKDVPGAPISKGKSQNKKFRVHWDQWVPNIYKIEGFFKKNGFIPGTFSQDKKGVWSVADVVTGATITEFSEYAGVLYKAFNK
jgi:hypothetical protein